MSCSLVLTLLIKYSAVQLLIAWFKGPKHTAWSKTLPQISTTSQTIRIWRAVAQDQTVHTELNMRTSATSFHMTKSFCTPLSQPYLLCEHLVPYLFLLCCYYQLQPSLLERFSTRCWSMDLCSLSHRSISEIRH